MNALIVENRDDSNGESILLENPVQLNEVVNHDGSMYEVIAVENDVARLTQIQVEEDWGE